MPSKYVTVVMLFLLISVPALGQDIAVQFELPPTISPAEAPAIIDAIVDILPAAEDGKFDWAAFFEKLIPFITLLVGLFGGGFGVRFRDRRRGRKKQEQDAAKESSSIMYMLKNLVPQLHGKVVLGDERAQARAAALVIAKEALEEVAINDE